MGQTLRRQSSTAESHTETETPAGNPLPHLIHAEVSPEQLGARRVICVGDVHGCADELENLLQKCQYKKENEIVVFNGDIINKGPKSVQVIDKIQSMNAIAVRGNQDDKALAAYVRWKDGKALDEQRKWLEQLGDSRAEWLRQLPFSLSIPSLDLLVVHAGLIPGIPLKQQSLKTLTELRDLPENLSVPIGKGSAPDVESDKVQDPGNHAIVLPSDLHTSDDQPTVPWASLWKGPQHVVFGHNASRKLQTWPCATGLDTGCCYGNQLTALIIPQQQAAPSAKTDDHKHVPSLSDLDASILMVPALKAYSKKK